MRLNMHRWTLATCMMALATALMLALTAFPVLAAPPGPGPMIGTNLSFLSDNSGNWPFVDVFKTSSGWYPSGSCGWDCGTLDLDGNGWVRSLDSGQMATALIFTQVPGMMPHDDVTQEYHVFYEGTGVIDYDGSVVSVVNEGPGHDRVRINPLSADPFALTILLTAETWDPDEYVAPTDYIRNIEVIAPGGVCSDSQHTFCSDASVCGAGATCDAFVVNNQPAAPRFHPHFLNNVRPFGVLRLMDWMDTIEGGLVTVADLGQESHARWNRAPATVMADLANTLDVDIWVNVPHLANDALITSMATDLAATLENGRKLYVEYSNELWNADFPAYQEIAEIACVYYSDLTSDCYRQDAQGQTIAGLPICHDHAADPIAACDTARIRYTTERSLQSWQIFETIFDAQNVPGGNGNSSAQLVRVLSSHSGNTDLHADLLSYLDAYQTVDAFATAAYFGWGLAGDGVVQTLDPDDPDDVEDFVALLQGDVQDTIDDMTLDRNFLLTHNQGQFSSVPFILYEGGQGLVAWGDNVDPDDPDVEAHANDVFDAANRHGDMALRYEQLLNGWRDHGGDVLFNHYVNTRRYTGEERYGALEHMRQNHGDSAKYMALMNFIDGLP